jgi:tetratricopeptide (TPR) repeat protein
MEEERHISLDLLRRFVGGTANDDEAARVVRHLLQGCDSCSLSVQGLLREMQSGRKDLPYPTANEYEETFRRAFAFGSREERRVALEKLQGWGQWSFLEPFAPPEREVRVRADASFHTWGLYKRLLDASRWYSRTDPAEAVDIVQLAIVVAELLDPASVAGELGREDLLAEAWAVLGNAKRLASDFEGARAAINTAWQHCEHGSGEPLTKALVVSLESSWLANMGEFELAEQNLEIALRIYRQLGDDHQQGRILLKMGSLIGQADAERGISHILRAMSLISTNREPRLELCAQHDLALYLNEAGRPQHALVVLERARPLYRQFLDDYTQLRLRWLEGKIARRLDQLGGASHTFRRLWEEFQARNLTHEMVLVSIDLAETYVVNGEFDAAAKLVSEVYPILKNLGLNRYALAAWLILQNALELRQVDGLFGHVRLYYRRYWNKPTEFNL